MFLVHSSNCASVGQFTIEQQVSDFEISALLGELIDRIAAIFEDAFVAVDECDAALARSGIHERRIVSHQTKVVVRTF